MTDFIIVGRGLAASCLMHQFHHHNISFEVIGQSHLSLSSRVAAGIWNPVVFKRLTSSWMNQTLVQALEVFYSKCETTLNQKLITQRSILKPFTEEQEKTHWKKKSTNELSAFLDPTIYTASNLHQHLKISHQFGKVNRAGNLDMITFIDSTARFFNDRISPERFNYHDLQIHADFISYQNKKAKNIIFCEGYLVKHNPYFNWIPLVPAKGETLTIKTNDIKLKHFIFNRDGFIMDLNEHEFKVGATYEWSQLNDSVSSHGLTTLKNKLNHMISCEHEITSHTAGVRPSSLDRRPIIGKHPAHNNLFVFNGLGAKGVMLAPFFTENFVHFYLQNTPLHTEVDVIRFYKHYESSTQK